MDCMLFGFENKRVPLMYGVDLVSLSLINSFNKTETATIPMIAIFPQDVVFLNQKKLRELGTWRSLRLTLWRGIDLGLKYDVTCDINWYEINENLDSKCI